MMMQSQVNINVAKDNSCVCLPPGLEDVEPEPPTIKKKTTLSLADLCAPPTPPRSPPGRCVANKPEPFEAPPGLPTPIKLDAGLELESDDTSAGSARLSDTEESGQSDEEDSGNSKPLRLGLVLALAERNQLKSDSKPFCPLLSSDAAAMLLSESMTPVPARTKLCSKAASYTPTAWHASDAWQTWDMQYGDESEYYADKDGTSSYDTSPGGYSEYDGTSSYEHADDWYSNQEWHYET
jgi:hypothetical protein